MPTTQTAAHEAHTQITNTALSPMRGWTTADFLDSARRLGECEGLSLADDWCDQLRVAARLIEAHSFMLRVLEIIAAGAEADGRTMDGMTKAAIAWMARDAIATATGASK